MASRKIRIAAACLLVLSISTNSFGGEVDVSGLTDAQVADLQVKASSLKATNLTEKAANMSTANPLSPNNISQYAELGKDLGVGLASTAKELGIAANEFAETPVGHIAMALIIYKVIGNSVLHFICGFLWLTSTTLLFIYFFRRLFMYDSVITNYDPNTGKRINVVKEAMNPRDVNVQLGRLIMSAALGVSSVIGLVITFSG